MIYFMTIYIMIYFMTIYITIYFMTIYDDIFYDFDDFTITIYCAIATMNWLIKLSDFTCNIGAENHC
jgi:hypothetical protein